MAWYEPAESPPSASIYAAEDGRWFQDDNNEEEEFEFEGVHQVGDVDDNQRNYGGMEIGGCNDALYRRLESLLSPMVGLNGGYHGNDGGNDNRGGGGANNYGGNEFVSPYAHPSYAQRESKIPDSILESEGFDHNSHFFYPQRHQRHWEGRNRDRQQIYVDTTRGRERDGFGNGHGHGHGHGDSLFECHGRGVSAHGPHHNDDDVRHPQPPPPPLGASIPNNDAEDIYGSVSEQYTNRHCDIPARSQSLKQSTLALRDSALAYQSSSDPVTATATERTWSDIRDTNPILPANHSSTYHHPRRSGKRKKKQKSKKNKTKKSDKRRGGDTEENSPKDAEMEEDANGTTVSGRPLPDIRAMMDTNKLSPKSIPDSVTQHGQECDERKDATTSSNVESHPEPQTKPKRTKRRRSKETQSSAYINTNTNIDTPISIQTLQQFHEHYNVHNAGNCIQALQTFVSYAKSQPYVTWTIVFHDSSCSTPFYPSTQKYCTEKGPPCTMWNCTCDNQVRGMQSSKPIVGAMFVFPLDSNDTDQNDSVDIYAKLECFLLPLGPTTQPDDDSGPDDIDPGYERMGHWPFLPITCRTNLRQRWDAFRELLMDKHLTCVTYNAVVALLPYHYHCLCDGPGTSNGKGNGNGICDTKEEEEHNTRHNDTYEETQQHQLDLILPRIWDLRLASWVLSPHSKEEEFEFETKCAGFSHLQPPQRHPPPSSSKQLLGLITAKEQLEFLYVLHPIVNNLLNSNELKSAFDDIESPVQSVLSAMECFGIGFKPERLLKIQSQAEERIRVLQEEARTIAGDGQFLLSSPQQVSRLLFDVMQISIPKGLAATNARKQVAGSNHRSTSEETLLAIQADAKANHNKNNDDRRGEGYRIIDILLEFRTLNKMLTTYIRPYPNFAREVATLVRTRRKGGKRSKKNRVDGMEQTGQTASSPARTTFRIHPMWMQTSVRTGRLSCRKPNMQQIPTGSVLGVLPRNSFTCSSDDKCLFSFDYSQNEVRILAHMSADKALLSMFLGGRDIDIYKQMSSAISGKDVEQVSDKERAVAKQVTLAIMYGMGLPQVAKKLDVNRSTAQAFFESFYGRFRGVKSWMDQTKDFARQHKYVKTISGRRRYLDDIDSQDDKKRKQSERQAINTVIQGSAADLMKLAMLKMASRIADWQKGGMCEGGSGITPKILLQIHDELLFEIVANKSDVFRLKTTVMRCCAEECAQELRLKVPLKLKCCVGQSWGNMKEI